MISVINTRKNRDAALLYFLFFSFVANFLLLHFSQRSSQSVATAMLLLSPLILLMKDLDLSVACVGLMRWVFLFVLLYVGYNFFVFTTHEASQLSMGKYRDIMFWILLPGSYLVFHLFKPTYRCVFIIFFAAALLSAIPIIKDLVLGLERGMKSAQPMYWGNLSLLTGLLAFTLSKGFESKFYSVLGYVALIFGLSASLWSQTRGGWLGIPLFFLLLLTTRLITWKECLVVFMVVVVIALNMPFSRDRLLYSFDHFRSGELLVEDDQAVIRSSSQQRLDMWRFALSRLPPNLWLGGGLTFYRQTVDQAVQETGRYLGIRQNNNVHNEFLEVLISKGLMGVLLLFLLLVMLFSLFYVSPKTLSRKENAVRVAGLVLVLEFLVFSLTAVVFSAKYPLVYFTLVFSFLASIFLSMIQRRSVYPSSEGVASKEGVVA